MIDGGRDYVKCNMGSKTIQLKIIDGEFYELEEEDFVVMKLSGDNDLPHVW